ncbi:MAG: hypothetical protein L6R37_005009 [Teloschistes peruensis]|nr:MAG: hypothetical protein L6R37_005009 [Teloschistes peruensis]
MAGHLFRRRSRLQEIMTIIHQRSRDPWAASSSFFPNSTGNHALPASLGPTSPLQHPRISQQPSVSQPQQHHVHQHQSPSSVQHPPTQAPSYSLPTLGPVIQQQHSPQASVAREREHERGQERDRQMNEYDYERLQRNRQEMMQRDYEMDMHEQLQREQASSPRENHTGSIPLQQPVPSRGQGTLHGPNGILAHLNSANGPNLSSNTSGVSNAFPGNTQPTREGSPRSFVQQPVQNLPHQQLLGSFTNAANTQQLPNGMAALSQGQQPILNVRILHHLGYLPFWEQSSPTRLAAFSQPLTAIQDALSYLDQVKVRFVDHPDVYNRFLDIMKDFKSQAIDTPGVIDRVSTLFAGHPELIQGFNTFLPPGYRIECGTRDDPNSIRVTTPMGTTVSQMPSVHTRLNGGLNSIATAESLGLISRQNAYVDDSQPDGEMQGPRQEQLDRASENHFGSNGRVGVPAFFTTQQHPGPGNSAYERDDAEAAVIAHQQEQRGVSNLSHAVSAVATNGATNRQTLVEGSPTPGPTATSNQANTPGLGPSFNLSTQLEKRTPVEFNHAIGYVNKIKNRFSQQPNIYKQFLEILQTYQRDLKPIQDVYSQVTQLFAAAPDLLEDFKQFLPESAAQAKAQAAARQATEDALTLSNVRGEASYGNGLPTTQSQTPKPEMRMPPVGNFAPPPSVGKDNKKRRGGAGSQITGGAAVLDSAALANLPVKTSNIRGGPTNKRAKLEQQKPSAPEAPVVSPTLVPSLPQPMAPSTRPTTVGDEIQFFDRVKKFMANKQTFNEFMKLCNLYTQELIDKNKLMHKALNFIGGNTELLVWLKNFIEYDGRDEIVENVSRLGGDKIVLSKCRGLGPSYRLLPRRERLRVCSGRDSMCQQVLNDEWVSHPTWASEDSGFIAHRKNVFEESIHRIEEERHDYDFNIEACLRTIQLIEPIVQQLSVMSDDERAAYVLPSGIGGQSETIYQRVIKKIYDRQRGQLVIGDMFRNPATVLPIVLGRLKQKAEEWKAGMREWEKVWRDQTQKMFWKSLDHQGISAKVNDKRQYQPKQLQNEIQTLYESQRQQRALFGKPPERCQLTYDFKDEGVVQDACHLMLTHLHHSDKGTDDDKRRVERFLLTFIPTFFGYDPESFQNHMTDIQDSSPPNEEIDEESVNEDQTNGKSRRAVNSRRINLLRGVLERSKAGKDINGHESKESTPDISSMDEDGAVSTETPQEQIPEVDIMDYRWMEHPPMGTMDPKAPYTRCTFNLYGSLHIYCFFRLFQMLYERLLNVQEHEAEVHRDIRQSNAPKAAYELNLVTKKPSDYFDDTSDSANYYHQIVSMCEDVMRQKAEPGHLEDTLRRFYVMKGWQLHSFDRIIAAIVRFAMLIVSSDNKDKSVDIVNLFYADRAKVETTHDSEIIYRKQVDKLTKDADIYRITYTPGRKQARICVFKKDDPTFSADAMEEGKQWAYYISSFGLREATEGVPAEKMHWPYLRRNLPSKEMTEEELSKSYLPAWSDEGLIARISSETYRISFNDTGTEDRWLHRPQVQMRGLQQMEEATNERKRKTWEKFGSSSSWMKELGEVEVEELKDRFQKSVAEGFPIKASSDRLLSADEDHGDVTAMTGA